MKKKFKAEGLGCANCTAKIEEKIGQMEGVKSSRISFLTEKAKFDLDDGIDLEAFLKEANKIADTIEPGARLVEK